MLSFARPPQFAGGRAPLAPRARRCVCVCVLLLLSFFVPFVTVIVVVLAVAGVAVASLLLSVCLGCPLCLVCLFRPCLLAIGSGSSSSMYHWIGLYV